MNEIDGIGRRDLAGAMAASAFLMLAGCSEKASPSVDSELSALADAISSLGSTVRRLSGDDSKDAVSDVQTDASDVANAFANLKAAMGKK